MEYHPEEFIGQNLTVKQAKNESLVGISGTIVDETKKTFTIKTNNGEKTILKNGCIFTINNSTVEGDEIALRPEERIKRK